MNCPRCGALPIGPASYCSRCGTPLPLRCSSCGELNERSSNFCFNCGTSLAAPQAPPEVPGPPDWQPEDCPRCGESNHPGSSYCLACGLPLESRARDLSGSGMSAWFRERPGVPAFSAGRPAGFWIRLVAFLIDGFLLLAVFLVTVPLAVSYTHLTLPTKRIV